MSGSGSINRDAHRMHATDSNYATRPYGVVTTAINPVTDSITYTGPRGGRTVPVSHPYLGPASWIRVMPERSTKMILSSRADSGETFTAAYMAENAAGDLIRATYDDNRFYFRRMQESEVEITSKGLASAHFAEDGTLTLRGGTMLSVMDVPALEINTSAPTIIQRTLDNKVSEISNETRFGVVKRCIPTDPTNPRWIQVTPEGGEQVFAKEYLRHVGSKTAPHTLVNHREGHVVADDGTEPLSPITGKKLRSHTVYGTVRLEETVADVDVEGNVSLIIPDGASYGYSLSVGRTDIKMSAGRDAIHLVDRNFMVDAASTIELEATKIKSGRNAVDPMIKGNVAHNWVGSAIVLTAMGPASFSPATVLSFADTKSTKSFIE